MCPKNYSDPALGRYLLDLIEIIKDEAFNKIKRYRKYPTKEKSKDKSYDEGCNAGYVCGYADGYSRVISLMLQQAEAFDIPLSDLGLDDIDPEKDLLSGHG